MDSDFKLYTTLLISISIDQQTQIDEITHK
jgi:hypothetical protein